MKNPAEEIVVAWLQECEGFFTMNNIRTESSNPKGGAHPEIDILAINKDCRKIWAEVSVSINPVSTKTSEREIKHYAKRFENKFKKEEVKRRFGRDAVEKWFICGNLSKKVCPEKLKKEMGKKGIDIKYFKEDVLDHLIKKIEGYRLDSARNYVNLFKAFCLRK